MRKVARGLLWFLFWWFVYTLALFGFTLFTENGEATGPAMLGGAVVATVVLVWRYRASSSSSTSSLMPSPSRDLRTSSSDTN